MALFMYSLTEFRTLIFECLEIAKAHSVVEVGSEAGHFTRDLAAWARERGGEVTCIDPAPSEAVRETVASSPGLKLLEAQSPAALDRVEQAEAFLLDGDHNYYSLLGELKTLDERISGKRGYSLIVMHDVCWPWARRDLYYNPSALPPEAVHPHTWDEGVAVGNPGTLPGGGFRSMGAYAVARTEGGPRNGLLTAVEDFLSGRDDLAFVHVPCIFGLGIIYSKNAPYARELSAHLRPYDRSWLLDKLEQNRLELFLKLVELFDGSTAAEEVVRAERQRLEQRVQELEAQLAPQQPKVLAG